MKFNLYEVSTDLIDFLRGEGKHIDRPLSSIDKQVKAHDKHLMKHTNKYLGIVIDFQDKQYFAPLTHDGDRKWFNRNECNDFERIYIVDSGNNKKYVGSLLLCKALPLTNNLINFTSLKSIEKNEGLQYMIMCRKELDYLNDENMQQIITNKMKQCIYGFDVKYLMYHVNFNLISKNIDEYNNLNKNET